MNTRRMVGLALVLLLTAPFTGVAQEDDATPRPLPELIRAALNRPESPAVWTGLAEALPELAITQSADPVTLFEASRLADSLAATPVAPRPTMASAAVLDAPVESGRAGGSRGGLSLFLSRTGQHLTSWSARLRSGIATNASASSALFWTPWLLVVLLLGATPVLRRRARRQAARAGRTGSDDSGEAPAPKDARQKRRWAVTTLAANGLPPVEIAFRTGMSQDAVQVLLGLRTPDEADLPAEGADLPPYLTDRTARERAIARRPLSAAEQVAGVTAARARLNREARKLKDGRITYGREYQA